MTTYYNVIVPCYGVFISEQIKPRLLMMEKGDVGFPTLLRACVRIGRFFVMRFESIP